MISSLLQRALAGMGKKLSSPHHCLVTICPLFMASQQGIEEAVEVRAPNAHRNRTENRGQGEVKQEKKNHTRYLLGRLDAPGL